MKTPEKYKTENAKLKNKKSKQNELNMETYNK